MARNCGVPGSLRTKSELSSHQMARKCEVSGSLRTKSTSRPYGFLDFAIWDSFTSSSLCFLPRAHGRHQPMSLRIVRRTQAVRELPQGPQGTTASTTPPFVRAGYDCRNNTTVWSRPEAVGWAPLVCAGPPTTPLRGLWVSGLLPPGNGGMNEGAATLEPTTRPRGLTHNSRADNPKRLRPNCHSSLTGALKNSVGSAKQGGGPRTPVCEGEGTQGPWRRGATACCSLSRQLPA